METDEALGTERRLHAQLTFSDIGAELLVHNGGARIEAVSIETVVARPARRVREARYHLEPGERLPLLFPLFEDEDPGAVTVRIRSRDRMLVLRRDAARSVPTKAIARLGSAVAAAALLIFVGHATLAPGALTPIASLPEEVADTVVAQAEATSGVVASRFVLPALVRVPPMRAAKPVTVAVIPEHPARSSVPASRPHGEQPRITSLQAPLEATSGGAVPVSYRAVGSNIRIVATIGPTIVARRSAPGPSGTVVIPAPPSDRDGRLMTVRAYASSGGRTATGETFVVLDRSGEP